MPRFAILTLAAAAMLGACRPADRQDAAAPPTDSLSVVDSFRTPESVLYDAAMDVYVVANINGSPFDKDDNGFLSRLAPDGRVLELKWVDGASDSVTLNAPKGMAIKGDTLFVADIDEVRLFDRTTGQSLGSRPVRGAAFLNDVAVGPDGTVYVTDTGLDRSFTAGVGGVWRFDARGSAQVVAGGRLGGPNGIIADSAGVTVNMWDGAVAHWTTARQRTALPRGPAQLDGLIRLADGALVMSSWADSSLHRLAPGDTAWTRVMGGLPSPADIGYDTRRERVLVPIFTGNRVEIRPLR